MPLPVRLAGLLLATLLAVTATPLWQPPNLFHSSMARNIRHLPCVSRRTGESGTCMFAFSCAKLNGTHLGTCIDRFYFGSCCKVPEESHGGDLDVVPPIEDNSLNSLDGTTTSRIRPAVTQKPLGTTSSTPYSRPTTQAWTTPRPTTQRPSSPVTQGSTSQWPVVSTQGPSSTPGSTFGSTFGSSPRPGSTPGFGGGSTQFGSTPSFGSSPGGFGQVSSQGTTPGGFPSSTPSSGRPSTEGGSSTSQGLPTFPQLTTAPPTLVTWTTIEEATGKPPPISIRPQVSEVSGGTHRPTLVSSTERPTSAGSSEKPGTVVVPVATVRPPAVSSPRPPPSTHRPSSPSSQRPTSAASTQRPSSATTAQRPSSPSSQRPSSQRPTTVTGGSRPSNATASKPKPTSPKPSVRPPQPTKPSKPVVQTKPQPTKPKPKPTSKPKPQPAKPSSARPTPTTTTTSRPPPTTTTASPSSTTQSATSETWVPVSVSTHEPSTTQQTTPDRPSSGSTPISSTSIPVLVSSTGQPPASSVGPSSPGSAATPAPGLSTSSVALPSVMSTTQSPPPALPDGLNMSNYKDVCGRRLFPDSRVVGGDKSTFGKWPWQISLRQWRTSTYLHKCGAALLNENWAITAAHCVENVPPSDLLLRLGEHDLSIEDEPFGYQERRVQIVASHPQFDPRTFEYDLALLRFYEPVSFQPNIIPICVPEDDTHFVGTTAYVTGWGRLYEDGPLPSVLQEVSVPVINNTLCETMYRAAGYIEHIPDIFICAGWKKGGFDSCEGDSGGPMVIQRPDKRWLLAGVISWGIGCAEPNQPGVYTRISQFRHWINQILQF